MLKNLGAHSSVVSQYLAELRDISIQSDRQRFRRNMERLGEIFAYEISKELPSHLLSTKTPLGTAQTPVPAEWPVLVTILRAGLPLHQGMLNVLEYAENGYIGAYRKHTGNGGFEIKLDYLSCPSLSGRIAIIADPMLATGSSIVRTLQELMKLGTPKALHIVSVISAAPGVAQVEKHFPNATIWTAGVDPELNDKSYIVPGLGDAGDLAFGMGSSH
jgi:uracil phosphoribosyltransferase